MVYLISHPFKDAVKTLLKAHFSDAIVDRFHFDFEANVYGRDLPNIRKQIKDERYIVEVRYRNTDGTFTYICDLFTEWDKKRVEYALLKYITDKYKDGKISFDDNPEQVNRDIITGTYETKEVKP